MRDSAFKRIFWMIVFGLLLLGLVYGSFFWSLEQTIRITSLVVEDGWPGVVFGFVVQFSPTAFLYMASSYNSNSKDEQNQKMLWLAAFWGMSLFDGFTNLGARFDRISVDDTPPIGFANPAHAVIAEWIALGLGVILDFAIVFAEELLGHIISVFFDNLSALIVLLGGTPPKWLAMAAATGRAVGGGNMKSQHPQNKQAPNQNQQNHQQKQKPKPQSQQRPGHMDRVQNPPPIHRPAQPPSASVAEPRSSRHIPLFRSGQPTDDLEMEE